jgi:hypothetical protein
MYRFRGELNNRRGMVDIIDFVDGIALCTDGREISINEFNTILYPVETFKKEILKIEDKVEVKSVQEPQKKKNS